MSERSDAGSTGGAPPASRRPKQAPEPAKWGRPLVKIDVLWTQFEMRLCVVVLTLEIVALSAWIALKGMSSPPDSGSPAGTVFRALFGALVLGLVAYWGLKKQSLTVRRWGAIAGVVLGIFLARYWAKTGVEYTSNLLNWYQQASSLTLLGGLRGVGTRLTLLLALLGGSLATGAGKHITIDLVTRFLKPKARVPVVVIGWIGAAIVCLSASWGFFDHVAIEDFGAKAEARPGQKIARVKDELGEHWFIFRRQVQLDLKATPHIVFKGEKYAEWLDGKQWNAWIDEAGIPSRYAEKKAREMLEARSEGEGDAVTSMASTLEKEEAYVAKLGDDELLRQLKKELIKDIAETLRIEDEDKRAPMIVVPGKGEPRGELVHAANLVFPIGLLIIALRFLLRSLLVIGGHVGSEGELDDDQFDDDGAPAAEGEAGAGDETEDDDAPATEGEAGAGDETEDDGGKPLATTRVIDDDGGGPSDKPLSTTQKMGEDGSAEGESTTDDDSTRRGDA